LVSTKITKVFKDVLQRQRKKFFPLPGYHVTAFYLFNTILIEFSILTFFN